jgi:hypothetical protein
MLTFIRGGDFGASSNPGQVWVKLLPAGQPVQLTQDQWQKERPVFSPDGSRVIYTAVTQGFRWDSWHVPVLGGAPQPFLPNASGLSWIDDRRLLYSEITSGVHMGIVTSTETRSDHRWVYHLYRMKDDGSAKQMIVPDDVNNLMTVSPDGQWAFALMLRSAAEGGDTYMQLISTRGDARVPVCNDACVLGFGPVRLQSMPLSWSADGGSLFVSLQYFGLRTGRTVILPYRSDVPPERLWPKGLRTEVDIAANPGARVINERNVFPAHVSSAYLFWRRTTFSNLYRIPIPR